ncbi:hypothetical protein TSTA_023010 [Talaromyces stipitatus ATCC 10500]|uniref:Uncharacterized protein n=1 Tax=Talaromyces stipitatus (strain ATCC 10500 / CBS 375.48 / QM 6759 / NRRL 1006) TaxID=441959 RepID=B8MEW4_TALSN|nr:uncharacterized protein TSTA_023010 [Talaromyces stipitatus ATCC 10500]EED17247.1 hypothetical protein TSTA_023010 [Talaromyces stipitatus ATCC 10500]
MIKLQQLRIAEAPILDPFSQQRYIEKGTVALSSTVNMIAEICTKFNAVGTITEAELVPLPALICTGIAAIAELQINGFRANLDALKKTLELCSTKWKLACYYLNKLETPETTLEMD